MQLSLQQSTELCRLLADETRVRLLILLEAHELSVAELTEITGLAQSRISTHLSRLKRAALVSDRRIGAASLFSTKLDADGPASEIWNLLKSRVDDRRVRLDTERAEGVISARKHGQTWADSVAGRMELHYSPGRTWEVSARSLIGLLTLGDVLDVGSGDGVLAELIGARARSVACADISAAVLAAARKRLNEPQAVSFCRADMHALPYADKSFDHVFVMHALSYTKAPQRVLNEAARVLRPKGRLIVAALAAHQHRETMREYDHVNLGVSEAGLAKMLATAGLDVQTCHVSSRETRPPYLAVVTALAQRGGKA